jgi:hypothetical protein
MLIELPPGEAAALLLRRVGIAAAMTITTAVVAAEAGMVMTVTIMMTIMTVVLAVLRIKGAGARISAGNTSSASKPLDRIPNNADARRFDDGIAQVGRETPKRLGELLDLLNPMLDCATIQLGADFRRGGPEIPGCDLNCGNVWVRCGYRVGGKLHPFSFGQVRVRDRAAVNRTVLVDFVRLLKQIVHRQPSPF